jgi:hypothetical protein
MMGVSPNVAFSTGLDWLCRDQSLMENELILEALDGQRAGRGAPRVSISG